MSNGTASTGTATGQLESPSLADVQAAAARIEPYIHHTPIMRCSAIDEIVGASVHFKCENLQKVGAFKFRGACNTVLSLSEKEIENGIATHSSGNHGAAVALAARLRGTTAVVVMPSNTSAVKQAAVAHYGARIVHCEPNDESRRRTLEAIIAGEGRTLVHPFDDVRVIAGQGTAALEFLEQVPDLDIIMTPVGRWRVAERHRHGGRGPFAEDACHRSRARRRRRHLPILSGRSHHPRRRARYHCRRFAYHGGRIDLPDHRKTRVGYRQGQ